MFVIPTVGALVLHVWSTRRLYPNLSWKAFFSVYDPTPTAWDFAASRFSPGFVRVLTKDGGGLADTPGKTRFSAATPNRAKIFVQAAWQLGKEGQFEDLSKGPPGCGSVAMTLRSFNS